MYVGLFRCWCVSVVACVFVCVSFVGLCVLVQSFACYVSLFVCLFASGLVRLFVWSFVCV